MMMIRVWTLTGRIVSLDDVSPSATMMSLKVRVQSEIGVPTDQQRFHCNGRMLDDDDRTCAEYNVQDETRITMIMRLRRAVEQEKVEVAKQKEMTEEELIKERENDIS